MSDYTTTTKMHTLHCCTCGMLFGLPDAFDDKLRESHKTFYCPSGHPQSYKGLSDAEVQRRRAERAEAAAQRARDERDTAERRRRGEKAAKTRLRNKLARGECPCCGESFPNVKEHMAANHPEYEAAHAD
jgi:hypothetical protein